MIKRIEKIFAGLKKGIDVLGTHFLAGKKRQDVWTRHSTLTRQTSRVLQVHSKLGIRMLLLRLIPGSETR